MLLVTAAQGVAREKSDRAVIAMRLTRWADAFNGRDPVATCDLFAKDLIATVRGAPERGRTAVCAQLATAMGQPDRRLRYTPDIREIVVSKNLAVVRIVWTLEERFKTTRKSSREFGIDVFRKQSNGTWSISRFLSY